MISALLFLVMAPTIIDAQEADREETFEARIDAVRDILCDDGSDGCRQWTLIGESGTMDDEEFTLITKPVDGIGVTTPAYDQGDRVIVQMQIINGERYFIMSDLVRRTPLLWLGALFIVLVWLLGGVKALRSFVGMVASLAVLFLFIVPRILAGSSPVLVALVGSVAIMCITFLLGHGWSRKTAAAFAGTCGSLLVTGILAWIFTMVTHLTGRADEEIYYLLSDYPALNTTGILLAAIIIGTLGVLDDIAIAQASAVFELRGANTRWSIRQLYASATRIGSDHIIAAINTLILAYAGTALPLILLVSGTSTDESWWIFLNRESIATEIVRTLVGSIGLLAAVPLTTWIAAWMAIRTNPHLLPSEGMHHH